MEKGVIVISSDSEFSVGMVNFVRKKENELKGVEMKTKFRNKKGI
jgi:hypothetical protein